MNSSNNIFHFLVIALLLLSVNAAYASTAGHVQFVNGEVQLTTSAGQTYSVKKGDAVNEGDTLTSARNASVQIRMLDGGIVAMRSDTKLKFDSFKFSGKEDGSEQSFFSLMKGGFRAVTGMIGRINKPSYRVTTPMATIGIRGTDHETFVVTPDSPLATVAPAGAYNKVNLGETSMTTGKGTLFVLPNQMGFAGGMDQMPRIQPINTNLFTVTPAPAPQAKGDREEEGQEVRASAVVDNAAQEQAAAPASTAAAPGNTQVDVVTTTIPQLPITTTTGQVLSGAPALSGGNGVTFNATTGLETIETAVAPHAAGTPPVSTQLATFPPNSTYTFNAVGLTRADCGVGCFAAMGSTQILDSGWDSGVVHWGRWSNGIMSAGGWYNGLNFGPNQGFHYIIGFPTTQAQMPITGVFTYNLIGGTSPTPSDGAGGGLGLGHLISGSVTADFASATVNGNLVMGFNGSSVYQATYNGPVGQSLTGTTTFQSGSINVCGAGCSTQYQGIFYGDNATHLGVGYMINTNQNFNINGVAAYKR